MRKLIGMIYVIVIIVSVYAFGQQGPQNRGGRGGFGQGGGFMGGILSSPEEVIKKYDKDGDGSLSQAEIEEWIKDYELRMFDKDGDGVISEEEKIRADEMKERREEMRLHMFDKDGDGVVSEEEEKAGIAAFQERMRNRPDAPRGQGRPRN